MPRGGARPGAGRPRKSVIASDEVAKLSERLTAAAQMFKAAEAATLKAFREHRDMAMLRSLNEIADALRIPRDQRGR